MSKKKTPTKTTSAKATSKRATFEIDGKTYLAEPNMEEFLKEAGFTASSITKTKNTLRKNGIEEITSLMVMTVKELAVLDGISETASKKIAVHAAQVKQRGAILKDYNSMVNDEKRFDYLPTGSESLDKMLTYANGYVGWRTKTLIELYAEPSKGKSQVCMMTAAMTLKPKSEGGWGRGVVFIDTEGAFEGNRFKYLARYWGVDEKILEEKLYYARATNMDEIEMALERALGKAKDIDLGLIVVDSIMDALRSQYPVGGEELSNLQPRQKHLKRVLDKLKNIALIFNSIAMYTNHVRAEIGNYGPDKGPQGGSVMGHASDIRIFLDKPTAKETNAYIDHKASSVSIKMGRAKIVDCGFLPENVGYFLIGAFGVGDPNLYSKFYEQGLKIREKGYLCVNAKGEELPPLDTESQMSRSEILKKHKMALYG